MRVRIFADTTLSLEVQFAQLCSGKQTLTEKYNVGVPEQDNRHTSTLFKLLSFQGHNQSDSAAQTDVTFSCCLQHT